MITFLSNGENPALLILIWNSATWYAMYENPISKPAESDELKGIPEGFSSVLSPEMHVKKQDSDFQEL